MATFSNEPQGQIAVKVNLRDMEGFYAAIKNLPENMLTTLEGIMHTKRIPLRRKIRSRITAKPQNGPHPEGSSGRNISRRRYDLWKAIDVDVKRTKKSVTLLAGVLKDAQSDRVGEPSLRISRYAEIIEEGSKNLIYPRHAKMLAFPPGGTHTPARDYRGVQTYDTKTIKSVYRTWPLANEDGAGQMRIVGVPIGAPRGTRPQVIFLLAPYTYIPARPYIRPNFEETEEEIAEEMDEVLEKSLSESQLTHIKQFSFYT